MARPLPHVDGVAHRFVRVRGLQVHLAEAGSGGPLILLHGWPQHWYAWRDVIPRLALHRRVICPDLRGHGWSDAPASGYDKQQLADDLLALLDFLELEQVDLVGHDWGGFAGFLACLRAPQRFSRFVALAISHPWPLVDSPDPRPLLRLAYQVVLAAPGVGPPLLRRTPFVRLVMELGAGRRGMWSEAHVQAFSEPFRRADRAHAAAMLYRTFLTRELLPLLRGRYRDRRLQVPTLLIGGARDPVVTERTLRGYERHADDMRVEVVRDAGHFLPEECPELVARRILSHLG